MDVDGKIGLARQSDPDRIRGWLPRRFPPGEPATESRPVAQGCRASAAPLSLEEVTHRLFEISWSECGSGDGKLCCEADTGMLWRSCLHVAQASG
jgi:hypothetical protein